MLIVFETDVQRVRDQPHGSDRAGPSGPGQELFMLTTGMAHNAIAHAQWRKRNNLPNAFDNTA